MSHVIQYNVFSCCVLHPSVVMRLAWEVYKSRVLCPQHSVLQLQTNLQNTRREKERGGTNEGEREKESIAKVGVRGMCLLILNTIFSVWEAVFLPFNHNTYWYVAVYVSSYYCGIIFFQSQAAKKKMTTFSRILLAIFASLCILGTAVGVPTSAPAVTPGNKDAAATSGSTNAGDAEVKHGEASKVPDIAHTLQKEDYGESKLSKVYIVYCHMITILRGTQIICKSC